MREMPLVSVIIPTYNAENTIKHCIDSVLAQDYQNFEVICCDDCSVDLTVQILREYEENNARIKILVNDKNMRAAFSRNQCIKIAKGLYIAQIDDDDYCAPNRLSKQVDFLEKNAEYAFVGSNACVYNETGILNQVQTIEKPTAEDFLWSSCFINPSVMFRRTALESVGYYRVAKETRRSQDYDLFMRLYAAGFTGYNLRDKLLFYYRGEKSYPKCKYKYRIDEMKIRYINFKKLGLLPKGIPYVIKPLIVGAIPIRTLESLKRKVV